MPAETPRAADLSWRSPALIAVALASFASVLISVTYRIDDPDLWQHLAVGKSVWQRMALPVVHEWTWPSWGTPEVNPSWGFEALLWPFWDRGGLLGLFAWRWITTLAAFAFLWAAARRMGATGLVPAFVLALCGLTYRLRSDLRPETLSAVLLAALLWILESRRSGGPDRTPWLVPIAWVWANTHISYYLGLFLIALYFGDAWLAARAARTRGRRAGAVQARAGAAPVTPLLAGVGAAHAPSNLAARWAAAPPATRLFWIGLAAAAVSFLNPTGWRALWQPFEYILYWRNEPVFQNIPELAPPRWEHNWRSGLPLLIAGWLVLAAWRARRVGVDRVELVIVLLFTAQALAAQRFLGTYAVAAAPFVSRDLTEWLAARTWGKRPMKRAAGAERRAARAAVVAAACLAIGPLEWSRWDLPLGVSMDHASYVIRATEFMAEHGVRGRGMNTFGMSGYQIYRFWPERERLPFIDIHVSGTKENRDLYAFAQVDSNAWARLDTKHRFDYVLLARVQYGGDRLLNTLDRDPAFALVFKDDVAALFVRRAGPLSDVAQRFAYRVVPAGNAGMGVLGAAAAGDLSLRAPVREELQREVRGSPWHGQAYSLLANLALMEADWKAARMLLDSVLAIDHRRPRAHQRLGLLDLIEDRPRNALRHFAREVEIHGASAELDVAEARAWAQSGRLDRARAACRRALKRDPAYAEAADSLAAWERRSG
ncbi:MAG: hypothetical protein ABIS67_00010 [Candidatus Eisenbacteria bacterium]